MATSYIEGGEKLKKALADIASKLDSAESLRVGFLEGATYPDGTPVAMVAAIDNFGAPRAGIPPRPFFSNMVKDKSPAWPDALGKTLVANGYDAKAALEMMGEGITGQLRQSIADTYEPALSPVTLMLRKMKSQDQSLVVTGRTVGEAAQRVRDGESTAGASTKPLVESGHMINSADYEVS